jgi:hypothetical protein
MPMLDDATVKQLERHWEEGWNACDLETIMAPMGDDVVFTSPFVATVAGDPSKRTIHGYTALRSYIADSLRQYGGIRYTLDSTYVGTDTVLLAYLFRLPDGTEMSGVDSMRVDGQGKVVEWQSHDPLGLVDEVRAHTKD